MSVTIGTTLGPYEILSKIGVGGMGEVYKARDTRLNRTVAIKVLPSHLTGNTEMKARFEREAQTIAGLNHPHICVLHDVGHQAGTDYLVMEYLEGQTLAERLGKSALPFDEALKIAIEIADALDKAHRQGVVHRDLKPSNVMLTKSGAKLLDFGLAKLRAADPKSVPVTVSAAPTDANALVWFERSGRRLESVGKPGGFFGVVVAPDHKKAVLEEGAGVNWLLEFSTGIASPLGTEKGAVTPIWAPDSERIAYGISLGNPLMEILNPSSGKKEAIPLGPEAIAGGFLQSWSPDGRFLVWSKSSEGQSDLWMASLDGKSKAAPFVQSPSNEFRAEISPDGHWIAYVSNESSREEVIVESFPQPGQRKRISTEGGNFPAWRPDGHELYYLEPSAAQRSKLMAVRVDASSTAFAASRPELLFETPPLGDNPRRGQFAAFGAGDRFLMNVLIEDTKPRAITVILNWPALLKQK